MALERDVHLRRDRAESFGAVADAYDRYRPGYPAALIADLVALRPARVLDIGCGTGKAARLLAASGLTVLGVEPDPKMADVARGHGLDVEVGRFEDWDDRGRRFGLVTAAQSWHWVDPPRGAAKAARVLDPGGALAAFWNYDEVDGATRAVLDDVYARHAPDLAAGEPPGTRRPHQRAYDDDLRATGRFAAVTTRVYRWARREPLEHWLGRLGTHSDHLLLGPERFARLRDALHDALAARGPDVALTGGTYLTLARVPG